MLDVHSQAGAGAGEVVAGDESESGFSTCRPASTSRAARAVPPTTMAETGRTVSANPERDEREPDEDGGGVEALFGESVGRGVESEPFGGRDEDGGEQGEKQAGEGLEAPPVPCRSDQPVAAEQQGQEQEGHGQEFEETPPGVLGVGHVHGGLDEGAVVAEEIPQLHADEGEEQRREQAEAGQRSSGSAGGGRGHESRRRAASRLGPRSPADGGRTRRRSRPKIRSRMRE